MAKRIYQSSKTSILETAKKILLEEGLGNLSTDNLIAKSGLSKGGFFYHFKTKNDLIEALSHMLLTEMDEHIQQISDKDPNKHGVTLRSYLKFTLTEENDEIIALCRSLIEVMFDKNHKSDPYKEYNKNLIKKMQSEGLLKEFVMSSMLFVDGYWYNEVFEMQPFSRNDIKKYIKNLIKLTE